MTGTIEIYQFRRINFFQNKGFNHKIASKNKQTNKQTNEQSIYISRLCLDKKLEYFFFIQFYELIKEIHRHAFSASRAYSTRFIHP